MKIFLQTKTISVKQKRYDYFTPFFCIYFSLVNTPVHKGSYNVSNSGLRSAMESSRSLTL